MYNEDFYKELVAILSSNSDRLDPNDIKSREMLKKKIDRVFQKHRNEPPKETVPYEIGLVCYQYILENGGSAQEAMEYAIKTHDKSIEWLDEVKHRPYYHAKRVVMECDTHPEQKVMLENGTMDKSALKSSKTISQQINKLSKYKQVSDTLEELKTNDKFQQERIENLEATTSIHEREIDFLQNFTGIGKLSDKETARLLFENGCTQQSAVEHTGKSVSTIKRWWKEFQS